MVHGRCGSRAGLGAKQYMSESIPLKMTRRIAPRRLYAARSRWSSAAESATTASARSKTNRSACSRTNVSLRFVLWTVNTNGALAKLQAATPSNPVTVPAFLAQFPFAYERPTVAYYNEASAALQLAIQEALTGIKTPQQALDEAAATWVSLASK